MTAAVANITTVFANAIRRPASLAHYQQAYVNYRRFKALTTKDLNDLGISQGQVQRAQFRDFVGAKYR